MALSRVTIFKKFDEINETIRPNSACKYEIVAVGSSGHPKPDGIFYVVYNSEIRSFELTHITKKEFKQYGSRELDAIMNYLFVRNYNRKSNSLKNPKYISVVIPDYYSGGIYLPKKYLTNFDELLIHYEREKKKIIGWVKDYAHEEYFDKLTLIYDKVMEENGFIDDWNKYKADNTTLSDWKLFT